MRTPLHKRPDAQDLNSGHNSTSIKRPLVSLISA